jgi:hypothetical protein
MSETSAAFKRRERNKEEKIKLICSLTFLT